MNKYNISRPRKYEKDGVEKTYWDKVGEMLEFPKEDGTVSRIIKIPAIGLEANVFPAEERERAVTKEDLPFNETAQQSPEATIEYPAEEINPNDIPF